MIIRKQFKFEAAHIVRNCTSTRCKENIHGHSYIVEVFVEGKKLDRGCMILDFALFKEAKELIDSFDHSYCLWQDDEKEFKEIIYKINNRVVEMPISPSAEGYALVLFKAIDKIISNIEKKNEEGEFKLKSVRVHETATGYAEAFDSDMEWADFNLNDLRFTEAIKNDWKQFKGLSI